MDGQQNIKICNAKQAKQLSQYKNIKNGLRIIQPSGVIKLVGNPTISLSTCAPDGHLLRVTIPDAASIQFKLLMMSV